MSQLDSLLFSPNGRKILELFSPTSGLKKTKTKNFVPKQIIGHKMNFKIASSPNSSLSPWVVGAPSTNDQCILSLLFKHYIFKNFESVSRILI